MATEQLSLPFPQPQCAGKRKPHVRTPEQNQREAARARERRAALSPDALAERRRKDADYAKRRNRAARQARLLTEQQWRRDNPQEAYEAERRILEDKIIRREIADERRRVREREDRLSNPDKAHAKDHKAALRGREKKRAMAAAWRKRHQKRSVQSSVDYERRRIAVDPEYKLRKALRHRVSGALRRLLGRDAHRMLPGSGVRDLGCVIGEFKVYIESRWLAGMTWGNWGARDGWHLDHIKPLAAFDLTDREQFLEACHFTNYQPLWAIHNIQKGARLNPRPFWFPPGPG